MSRVRCLTYDDTTGEILESKTIPVESAVALHASELPPDTKMLVVPRSLDYTPGWTVIVPNDLPMIAFAELIHEVAKPPLRAKDERLEMAVAKAASKIDQIFGDRMNTLLGPLAGLHAEKARQAAAGGGPLVADDADKEAILANAAAQGETIALVEQARRRVKLALRAATSEKEVAAIVEAVETGNEVPA